MTKGGSGKSKTLGRLIFGEKRKQHASPTRHRSSARKGTSTTDLPSSTGAEVTKSSINLHDWAVWRMQLNEQMGAGATERRSELKQMRQFLQSNPFYQQYSRDPSNGRYNGVRLLFSIPHAKIKPEFLDDPQSSVLKSHENNDIREPVVHEQKKIRSNSDDRTTTSVNSISAVPPVVIDRTIAQLLPKIPTAYSSGFLQNNEPVVARDGMSTRRTTRSSFMASDRIHSTLQKTVKDGNVLEKIKAFEMQAAAAAQAESISKLSTINHRMQPIPSIAHRTLSPATTSTMQKSLSPMPIPEQSFRSQRDRYVHPGQQDQDGPQVSLRGHESRKGAHLLEPAHGDIILRRRTPSQKVTNDDDRSVTAISSLVLTASQGHHRNHPHNHQRTSVSRSRHRQEMNYEKRTPSHHEHYTRRHSSKQRGATTPSGKSSTRRRWSKGQKETPVDAPSTQRKKPDTTDTRANKNKKKTVESDKPDPKKVPKSRDKEKSSSDNNRVYGVPETNAIEQAKIDETRPGDAERGRPEKLNTFARSKKEDAPSSSKPSAATITRQASQKCRQQHVATINEEMLNKVPEKSQSARSNGNPILHFEHDDDDDEEEEEDEEEVDDEERSGDDVFIKETPMKPVPNITRHQSIIKLPKNEPRCFQQQSTNLLRRRDSQRSAEDTVSDRACPLGANTATKQQSPITLITRKHPMEPMVYEAPYSEQTQPPVSNTHTMKKKRPFHTINTAACSMNNGQKTNNKQISKQILHAIMNSMNNNQETVPVPAPTSPTSMNDDFFDNGPLSNPEETIVNMTAES